MQQFRLLIALHLAGFVFRDQFQHRRRARAHIVDHTRVIHQRELLREVTGDQSLPPRDDAAVRILRAREDAHQARLPAAIATDETDLFALMNAHRRVIEDLLQAKLQTQVFRGDDGLGDGR